MRKRATATFDEADRALQQTLDELDENVPNYNEWVRRLVEPAAVGRVIELGAGVGTFTTLLLQTADHVVAVEPSERHRPALESVVTNDERVTPVHGYASDAKPFGPFDGAVLSNVLEHIDDDVGTLRELFDMTRPGGRVAVFSPAYALLMSDFDRSIGHVRRYRKRELCDRFRSAGFDIDEARYVNVPGFFAWLIVTRLFHKRPTNSRLSHIYDRFVVPAARWVESHVRAPFGQSVLVIGRVPTSTRAGDGGD